MQINITSNCLSAAKNNPRLPSVKWQEMFGSANGSVFATVDSLNRKDGLINPSQEFWINFNGNLLALNGWASTITIIPAGTINPGCLADFVDVSLLVKINISLVC